MNRPDTPVLKELKVSRKAPMFLYCLKAIEREYRALELENRRFSEETEGMLIGYLFEYSSRSA